jgi:nucleotide-binding universal stress UspA family protein
MIPFPGICTSRIVERLPSDLKLPADLGTRWSMTNILVPLDFDQHSWRSLAPAARLHRDFSCTVTLLHVVHLNIVGEERGVPRVQFVEEMKRAAEQSLQAVAASFPATMARSVVRVGEPVDVIAREADDSKTDLIILSQRRRPGLRSLFGRSVARRLVDRTSCPVLVVP